MLRRQLNQFAAHRTLMRVVLALICMGARGVFAAEYYIAPAGDDRSPGTIDKPFATLARAQLAVGPGDTVWIRGGVYELVGGRGADACAVLFDKSGTADKQIRYWAFPDEKPVFDFSRYVPNRRIRGFSVQASYLHFEGLTLRKVQQVNPRAKESWAIRVEGRHGGHHNVFERLDLHDNEGPGLFIEAGGDNLVLNCDSHHNYDPDRGGENADGFGSHSDDDGNRFIGNRAWENSDDGYDFINSRGTVELIDSWAWRNGFVPGTDKPAGNGAGVKAGGFGLDPALFPKPGEVPTHVIRGNLSFNNRAQGFYANHHPGGIQWMNNTAFNNPHGFNLLNDVQVEHWPADHFLRNNIAFGNKRDLIHERAEHIDEQSNSWSSDDRQADAKDFISLKPSGVDGARRRDGSLPVIDFMRLQPSSRFIDTGVDVGRDFAGDAPDLGAFEWGIEVPGERERQ